MSERESSIAKIIRNGAAAAVIIPASTFYDAESTQDYNLESNYPSKNHLELSETPQHLNDDQSFFELLDELVESNKGRALASALVVTALGSALYNRWHSQERDKKRKEYEMLAASGLFLTLSTVILTQSFIDIDPKIPASILQAYAVARGIYSTEDSFERDRKPKKRASNLITTAGVLAASSTLLVDSLQ